MHIPTIDAIGFLMSQQPDLKKRYRRELSDLEAPFNHLRVKPCLYASPTNGDNMFGVQAETTIPKGEDILTADGFWYHESQPLPTHLDRGFKPCTPHVPRLWGVNPRVDIPSVLKFAISGSSPFSLVNDFRGFAQFPNAAIVQKFANVSEVQGQEDEGPTLVLAIESLVEIEKGSQILVDYGEVPYWMEPEGDEHTGPAHHMIEHLQRKRALKPMYLELDDDDSEDGQERGEQGAREGEGGEQGAGEGKGSEQGAGEGEGGRQGAGEGEGKDSENEASAANSDGDVVVVESKSKTRPDKPVPARTSKRRRSSSKAVRDESEMSEESASEAPDDEDDEEFKPPNSKDNKKAAANGRARGKRTPGAKKKIPRKRPAAGDGSSQAGGAANEEPAQKKRKKSRASSAEPKAAGLTIYLRLQGAKDYNKVGVSTVCQLPCFAHPTRCLLSCRVNGRFRTCRRTRSKTCSANTAKISRKTLSNSPAPRLQTSTSIQKVPRQPRELVITFLHEPFGFFVQVNQRTRWHWTKTSKPMSA